MIKHFDKLAVIAPHLGMRLDNRCGYTVDAEPFVYSMVHSVMELIGFGHGTFARLT